MSGYGAIAQVARPPAHARTAGRTAVAAASLLVVAGVAMLSVTALANSALSRHSTLLQRAAHMNMVPLSQTQMLCEGHFLDTATGIPEVPYSTLHHPAELPGFQEPLPPNMRAAIDQEYYGAMVSPTYSTGCHLRSRALM